MLLADYPIGRLPSRKRANAKRTLRRWRQMKPFDDASTFKKCLSLSGVSEAAAETVLCFPMTRGVGANEELIKLASRLNFLCASPLVLPESLADADGHNRLLNLVYPLIAATVDAIEAGLPCAGSGLMDAAAMRTQAETDLCRAMLLLIQKTCLWELKFEKLRGGLVGGTPHQRYESFVNRLATPKSRRQFFEQYPVLLQLVCKRLDMYRENLLLMLRRLDVDCAAIARTFFGSAALPPLENWTVGAGDSHRKGQSVVCLQFRDDRRLVYKPRSLGVDVGFAQLVAWCNQKLPDWGLRTANVIECGSYGWSEYITYKEAESERDVATFYRKQGMFLGLFYGLHASDMHHENVICHGADPLYIDLETLFHPQLPGRIGDDGSEYREWPITVASTQVVESRLRPGAEGTLPDLSALGARDGQRYPGHAFDVVDAGTDSARLEEAETEWQVGATHLPKRHGEFADAKGYLQDIISGFKDTYDLFLNEKEFLASSQGISLWFAETDVRLIPRPTELYDTLIQRSLHPDFLCDAAERHCFLAQILDGSSNAGAIWMDWFVPFEVEDMEAADVPMFFQHFGDSAIYSSKGTALAATELASPQERVIQHALNLSPSDRDAQARLIATVLGATPRPVEPRRANDSNYAEFHAAVAERRLVDAARLIADQLVSQVIERGRDRYWLCKAVTSNGLMLLAGAVDLYDGMLGILLFLGLTSKVTGTRSYADVALSALDTVRRWTNDGVDGFGALGPFSGVYGLPYVLACLSETTGNVDLGREAVDLSLTIQPDAYADSLDIFGGAAGVILFLATLLDDPATPAGKRGPLEARIEEMADRLLESAIKQPVGVGWTSKQRLGSKIPLTGFSHGNAGMAAALYTATRVLGVRRYRELANQAIAYENANRTPAGDNWLDLREQTAAYDVRRDRHESMCAWCHGAPGILLGRLICLECVDDDAPGRTELCRDAATAFRTTCRWLASGGIDDVSLCHGLLGNLAVIHAAISSPLVATSGVPKYSLGDRSIAWRCGDDVGSSVAAATSDPGLMLGRAGIGYALLHRTAPATVPSLLRLQHTVKHFEKTGSDSPTARPACRARPTLVTEETP